MEKETKNSYYIHSRTYLLQLYQHFLAIRLKVSSSFSLVCFAYCERVWHMLLFLAPSKCLLDLASPWQVTFTDNGSTGSFSVIIYATSTFFKGNLLKKAFSGPYPISKTNIFSLCRPSIVAEILYHPRSLPAGSSRTSTIPCPAFSVNLCPLLKLR